MCDSGKELHRELKRCKKCLTFSGVNVTMQVSCKGRDRQLRMDILDRDIFDSAPHTPANTSWTMTFLTELDTTLGWPDGQAIYSLATLSGQGFRIQS